MTKRVVTAMAVLLAVGLTLANWMSVGGSAGSAKVTILDQNTTGTTFEVTVPGVEVTPTVADGKEFSTVNLPGEVMATLEQGKPQVPKVSVLLAIPNGAQVSCRVVSRETRTLKVANVYPLQPPLLDGQQPGPLVRDAGFYSQDVSYPATDLSPAQTGVWRDLATTSFQVYPVKVNPARGEVEVATRIRVRVDYAGGTYPQTVASFMIPMYAEYINNFPNIGAKPQTDYTAGVRYLVIGNTAWQTNSYLNDSLLGWVKQRGYDVRTIWKSSWTDIEIKDSINQEYIRNTPKVLQFVLLVGEYAEIPMHPQGGVGHGDYWYSDLEPYNAGDNYPEIALARLSPSSSTDLDNMVKKILKYQKNPPGTDNWLDKYTMVAHSEEYPGKYSGCVRGIYGMPKPYWNPGTLETIMGYYTGNATVSAAINAGRGIVAYRGHGDVAEWWEWGTEGSWYNSHIEALTNGDMTPVVYNVNCLNGDIATAECMLEKWLRKYPGGSAGSLGATQASYTYPNHGICSTLVRASCDTWRITVPGVRDYVGPYFHLSEHMMYFDAYVAKYWPGSPYPDNIYMYIMLGDPSMPVWAGGMPVSATVTKPDSIPTGPYNLNVTVQAGGQPVEGALVCAWKGAEVYVSERTDATGSATLAVNASTNGPMKLTVSEGHARHSTPAVPHTPILPYEGTINVGGGGSTAPNIIYLSNQVIDSTGNNNGMFDPGENGKIYVTIRNNGNADATNVTGVLSSNNAQFTISDPNAAYGTIAIDSSKTNRSDPFTASAGAGIPPGTVVTCTLKIHSDNWAHDWTYTFNLQIGVPPRPAGEIIWGPKTCPGMPVDWGLYGVSYNSNDNLIYCSYMHQPTLYKYSSDSALSPQGTVTLPNDSCTDLDYITYANAFWVLCNPQKIMYKITPTGTVLSQFSLSFIDYPCGVTENEAEHKLYISDRRSPSATPQRIYVTDTAGNVLDTITHPLQANYGTRCLALDARCPTNPPSLLNIYTWFDASGTILDSCGMYELDRVGHTVLNGYVFPDAAWNIRGIECDPRDGSYWITIMQGGTTENMIFKVVGFNYSVGVEEPKPGMPSIGERLVVRAQPNPFTQGTVLSVRLPAAGSVDLKVYDNNGRVVRTLASGTTVGTRALFPWDGRNEKGQTVAPGIYFYRVKSATAEAWGKVVLSR